MYSVLFLDGSVSKYKLTNPRVGDLIVIHGMEFEIFKILHDIDNDEIVLKVK